MVACPLGYELLACEPFASKASSGTRTRHGSIVPESLSARHHASQFRHRNYTGKMMLTDRSFQTLL